MSAWDEQVAEHDDGVEITGVTKEEALEALALRDAVQQLRFERSSAAAASLLQVSTDAQMELIDPAPVEQARRLANLRQDLLATPVYSYEALAEVHGDARTSTARTWVSRMRRQRRLFTVRDGVRTLIPALQLTDDGMPRPQLVGLLDVLMSAGVDGWPLWVWLTSPTPLLSGQIPHQVAAEDPARALRAASRFAARSGA